MNVDKLLKALDNNENESIINFTSDKIIEMNIKIIEELGLTREETINILMKLKNYKYVDEIEDLKYGTYLRWIPIEDVDHLVLTKGAVFCDLKITDNGLFLICKNIHHKYFQISMDKNLLFQKLTNQELIILQTIDQIQSHN